MLPVDLPTQILWRFKVSPLAAWLAPTSVVASACSVIVASIIYSIRAFWAIIVITIAVTVAIAKAGSSTSAPARSFVMSR